MFDQPILEKEIGVNHWWTYRKIKVYYDENPTFPREWDNLGTIASWHRTYKFDENPRCTLGEWLLIFLEELELEEYDEDGSYSDEWADLVFGLEADEKSARDKAREILADHAVFLPVYLLDHSGLRISTSSSGFRTCDPVGWDWGQIGYIFVTRNKLKEEGIWDGGEWTEEDQERAERIIRAEIETLDDYYTGNVFGYVVEDWSGALVDSCWGFYGVTPEGLSEEIANGRV